MKKKKKYLTSFPTELVFLRTLKNKRLNFEVGRGVEAYLLNEGTGTFLKILIHSNLITQLILLSDYFLTFGENLKKQKAITIWYTRFRKTSPLCRVRIFLAYQCKKHYKYKLKYKYKMKFYNKQINQVDQIEVNSSLLISWKKKNQNKSTLWSIWTDLTWNTRCFYSIYRNCECVFFLIDYFIYFNKNDIKSLNKNRTEKMWENRKRLQFGLRFRKNSPFCSINFFLPTLLHYKYHHLKFYNEQIN